jgi:dynein assembly factor with WDR repeat domains 1
MRLKRLLIRYFPPGIVLEYARKSGEVETKAIDLLNLTPDTDVEVVINQIAWEERLISESKKPVLRKIIYKLLEKLENKDTQRYYEYKVLRAHILPLTNCAFNKSGSKFITGSYDRCCRVWDTMSVKSS